MEHQIDALSTALAKLPPSPSLPPDKRDAMPYQAAIHLIARQLTLMARVDPDLVVARAARAKLVEVKTLAATVAAKIEALSDDAVIMLDRASRLRAVNLSILANDFANDMQLPPQRDKGRQRKAAAAEIASYLALEFEHLTGERPTRAGRGPFVALLTAVFAILGIKANPGTVARERIRLAKNSNSREI